MAAADLASSSSPDRLGVTLCVAIVVHASVILGIAFSPEQPTTPEAETLEVILVQQRSDQTPEESDYLAQANLVGGGDSETKESPATPLSPPFPETEPEIAATIADNTASVPQKEITPEARPRNAEPVPDQHSAQRTADRPRPERRDELAVETLEANKALPQPAHRMIEQDPPRPASEDAMETAKSDSPPRAALLMRNAFAMASLNAEIEQRLAVKSKRPRRKFISASTRDYRYAAYMEAWRAKVERVGNLNYPEQARRKKLVGSLILDVALAPDGYVKEITLRRSSGHSVLDDAAVQIVKLAAPFAPFPDAIREEVDILHITRTWQFLYSERFASR